MLLRNGSRRHKERLVALLLPRVLWLAASKHGSNVAERLLLLMSPAQLEVSTRAWGWYVVIDGPSRGLLYSRYVVVVQAVALPKLE